MADLHIYDVLRRPVVSEKTAILTDEKNQYVFEVAEDANKIQIKEAIEVIFEVDVVKVNTMIVPAKRGRRGRNWYLRSRQWKKAVVTLAADQQIELFNT
ncbi:MAG: 50S ribosomal protein L23 [Chloroflexi bacterium]|nr:50S ribosomal protein L23 [Chloroflexota bacterium]MCC6896223.1 50S ribosomal protein L23 [Anaerolineae bacterium]